MKLLGLWPILLLWQALIPYTSCYTTMATDDLPPLGMSSLTFVFDRTGSMNDDLTQVRQGARGIFEMVMKQRKKLIYNYVLVLFHDPGNILYLQGRQECHFDIFKRLFFFFEAKPFTFY